VSLPRLAVRWRVRALRGYLLHNPDNDGKPVRGLNVEYNPDMCEKGKKLVWMRKEDQEIKLRKYPLCELNGHIYVWIHALE
jgi:hypothetical protein